MNSLEEDEERAEKGDGRGDWRWLPRTDWGRGTCSRVPRVGERRLTTNGELTGLTALLTKKVLPLARPLVRKGKKEGRKSVRVKNCVAKKISAAAVNSISVVGGVGRAGAGRRRETCLAYLSKRGEGRGAEAQRQTDGRRSSLQPETPNSSPLPADPAPSSLLPTRRLRSGQLKEHSRDVLYAI